ncbi:MAG: phosphoketolase family protein [Bacillota bacterium]
MELKNDELERINAYWMACNYLAAGMIYLRANPLLKEPLKPEHVKSRLLGHWGSSPGLSFIYVHLNRIIKKFDLDMIFIAGPGHGAPGVLAPIYLEGTYSEVYPKISEDEEGMRKLFKHFSFPGGIGSHCTPEMPGSIHEGGELGYSLSHAFGAAFDHPGLIVAVVVGDGEAETGPLATAWHSNKFLNPKTDGAVLPILHLNGYKIANPTILARISKKELESLFIGYGYKPYFVEGDNPYAMHREMAKTLEKAVKEIRALQKQARDAEEVTRPMWPMIVLRSPKGWTGPKEVNGHKVENFWRSHQVPVTGVHENPAHLKILEDWLKSYKPETLFDENGRLLPELRELPPKGQKRMSANPITSGLTRRQLRLPDFRDYAVPVNRPGGVAAENTRPMGEFLKDTLLKNPDSFRVLGPDETASNRLEAVYKASKKVWMGEIIPDDADGSELSRDGMIMEMLSEHTLLGWLEGYILTGRHGLFHTYEAFSHIIDSMFNQHAKWLDASKTEVSWRAPISSENILLSSTVWRQDHNGFSHQEPGFLDVVTNKSPEIVRIYLPPDANTLLSTIDHCLMSTGYVNVIVADKQRHLQYLSMDDAIKHCTKGIGIWDWASNDYNGDDSGEPDIVMASCGDVPTKEALAAVAILREEFPKLKVRFVNVVDLMKLLPSTEHPHGLTDREFNALFTADRPVIFNFHGYPWLIHKLTYKRANQERIHVRGYKEKGNINTPLELTIKNQADRFNLVIDVIDRIPALGSKGAHCRERMKNRIIENIQYAYDHGIDKDEITNWEWPY